LRENDDDRSTAMLGLEYLKLTSSLLVVFVLKSSHCLRDLLAVASDVIDVMVAKGNGLAVKMVLSRAGRFERTIVRDAARCESRTTTWQHRDWPVTPRAR